jgi:hypothetical protein
MALRTIPPFSENALKSIGNLRRSYLRSQRCQIQLFGSTGNSLHKVEACFLFSKQIGAFFLVVIGHIHKEGSYLLFAPLFGLSTNQYLIS